MCDSPAKPSSPNGDRPANKDGVNSPDASTSAASQVATGSPDDESLWPALQASAPLNSMFSGSRRTNGQSPRANRESSLASLQEGLTTDRVNTVVGTAFDRLWRDRPGVVSAASPAKSERNEEAAQSAGNAHPLTGQQDESGAAVDGISNANSMLMGSVDGFITHYFRHVAELSRESVYQAHQREILHRMRKDFIAGERSGNIQELDEMIQRVDLDDLSLRTEIASLMRIAENSAQRGVVCPVEVASCSCIGDGDYPPVMVTRTPLTPPVPEVKDSSGNASSTGACDSGASCKSIPACHQSCVSQ